MKVVIVRRVRGSTHSIDVCADNLIAGLRSVRPNWTITEIEPQPWASPDKLWMSGLSIRKYYECYWRYPKEVSQLQANIFHVIDQTDGHIARWLRNKKKSSVVTCHDLVQLIQPEKQSRFPALSLAVWRYSVQGMCQADHVIAVSSNTAQDINKLLNVPSDNISVALNGIEKKFQVLPQHTVEKFRQQYAASSKEICLLHVGGTHQRKNILAVLKTLNDLHRKGIPVFLWKAGAEFTPEHNFFIEEHQLEKHIIHFGNPSKDTLVSLYNAADVLLSPSFYEGFGLTILEAMACGTPVITSNISSLPEVAGNAAVLVNPNDVQAMIDATLRIKNDDTYRQDLVRNGLLRAQHFTWEKSAERVARVYERVLNM